AFAAPVKTYEVLGMAAGATDDVSVQIPEDMRQALAENARVAIPRTSYVFTGALRPRSCTSRLAPTAIAGRVSSAVASLATTAHPSALVWPSSREAMLTVSPTAVSSARPLAPTWHSSTSPVCRPTPIEKSGRVREGWRRAIHLRNSSAA